MNLKPENAEPVTAPRSPSTHGCKQILLVISPKFPLSLCYADPHSSAKICTKVYNRFSLTSPLAEPLPSVSPFSQTSPLSCWYVSSEVLAGSSPRGTQLSVLKRKGHGVQEPSPVLCNIASTASPSALWRPNGIDEKVSPSCRPGQGSRETPRCVNEMASCHHHESENRLE